MIIRIACCDDDEKILEILNQYISIWSENYSVKTEVLLFSNGIELLEFWKTKVRPDILFMDINLKDSNGFQVAKTIRQLDENVFIIFVTGLTGYLLRGYDIGAFMYLIKPIDFRSICRALCNALSKLNNRASSRVVIETDMGIVNQPINEILYIESVNHSVEIVVNHDKRFKSNTTLSEIEKRFDDTTIVRCHRAFLVNLIYIYLIKDQEVVLDNGKVLPMSRREKDTLIKGFLKHVEKK